MKKRRSQPSPHVQEQCGVWLSAKGRDRLQEGSNDQRLLPRNFRQPRGVLSDIVITQHKIRVGGKQSTLNKFFKYSEKPENQDPPSVAKRTKLDHKTIQMTLDGLPGCTSRKQPEKENQSPVFSDLDGGTVDMGVEVQQRLGPTDGGSDWYNHKGNYDGGEPRLKTRLKRKGSFEDVSVKKSRHSTFRYGFEHAVVTELSSSIEDENEPDLESLGISTRRKSCSPPGTDSRGLPEGGSRAHVLTDSTNTSQGSRSKVVGRGKGQILSCLSHQRAHSEVYEDGEGVDGAGRQQKEITTNRPEHCRSKREQSFWHPPGGNEYPATGIMDIADNTLSPSELEEFTPSILRDSLVGLDSVLGCETPNLRHHQHQAGSKLSGKRMSVRLPASSRDRVDSSLSESPETREKEAHRMDGWRRSIGNRLENCVSLGHPSRRNEYSYLVVEGIGDDTLSPSELEDFTPSILRDSLVDFDSALGCDTPNLGHHHCRASSKLSGKRRRVQLPVNSRESFDTSLSETLKTEAEVAHRMDRERKRTGDRLESRLSGEKQSPRHPLDRNEYSATGIEDIADNTLSLSSELEDFTPSILRDSLVVLNSAMGRETVALGEAQSRAGLEFSWKREGVQLQANGGNDGNDSSLGETPAFDTLDDFTFKVCENRTSRR